MKFKKSSLILFIIAIMSGCNQTTENNNSPTTFNNLKEALEMLKQSKNYTLVNDYYEEDRIDNTMFFTKDAYFLKEDNYQYGYLQAEDGVYFVDIYHRKLTASTLLKDENNELYTSLWSGNFFKSFNDFELKNIEWEDDLNEMTIKDKMITLRYMEMLNISTSLYSSIDSLYFKLIDNKSLEINLNYINGNTTKSILKDMNNTEIPEIKDFLSNGGKPYSNSKEQNKMIELFSNFNYKRVCLDNDNETVIGHEWYNKNYFYGEWEDDYYQEHLGEIMEIGVIGINDKEVDGQKLNGSYYFTYSETELSIITTMPINTNPDVTEVYNYPTYLLLFDNFQYFNINVDYENTIFTDQETLMIDFCQNFQIYQTIIDNNCELVELEISYAIEQEDKNSNITFTLYYKYNGQLGAFVYPFTSFNDTNIEIVDNFLNS